MPSPLVDRLRPSFTGAAEAARRAVDSPDIVDGKFCVCFDEGGMIVAETAVWRSVGGSVYLAAQVWPCAIVSGATRLTWYREACGPIGEGVSQEQQDILDEFVAKGPDMLESLTISSLSSVVSRLLAGGLPFPSIERAVRGSMIQTVLES